jgi:hypothetical protein
MNLKMLSAFNCAPTNAELLERIGLVADEWQAGTIEAASFDGDAVASLRLTELGVSLWPPTLPATVA